MNSPYRTTLLLIDSLINLVLGLMLLFFPARLVEWLGIPAMEQRFYPSLLGAVLFGIGIALWLEHFRGNSKLVGLGLGGAIAINLCGALVLAAWLVFGALELPVRGYIFLWGLVVVLIFISLLEISHDLRKP